MKCPKCGKEIEDGFLYKYSTAYRLDEADAFLIYTPKTAIADFLNDLQVGQIECFLRVVKH